MPPLPLICCARSRRPDLGRLSSETLFVDECSAGVRLDVFPISGHALAATSGCWSLESSSRRGMHQYMRASDKAGGLGMGLRGVQVFEEGAQ